MDALPAGGDYDEFLRSALDPWWRDANPEQLFLHDPYLCSLRSEMEEAPFVRCLGADALRGWAEERGLGAVTHLRQAANLIAFC